MNNNLITARYHLTEFAQSVFRFMHLFQPIYRLSRVQFFQYTLAYYFFVVGIGFIIFATGRSDDLIRLLAGLVLFSIYLNYLVRPRLREMGHSQWWALTFLIPVVNLLMLLVLLYFPGNQIGNQGSSNGAPKIVTVGAGLLAAPIILGGGLATANLFGMSFLYVAIACTICTILTLLFLLGNGLLAKAIQWVFAK